MCKYFWDYILILYTCNGMPYILWHLTNCKNIWRLLINILGFSAVLNTLSSELFLQNAPNSDVFMILAKDHYYKYCILAINQKFWDHLTRQYYKSENTPSQLYLNTSKSIRAKSKNKTMFNLQPEAFSHGSFVECL